ncbi:MAG: hypothetical protein KGJ11_00890 [Candidatus Omnitrophica bacterium]|nr:hypothetical protein [Candidatus Omnitrophota bacterium]
MNTSILSFPTRGSWGAASYRGNCSGFVQKSLIEIFRPGYFVDPAEGGGTSRDICRQLGVKYTGLDLKSGFNLLKDNLKDKLDGPADFVFFHPPYGEMITYSGHIWGAAHPDDLSRSGNCIKFLSRLEFALLNIYDSLKEQGHYSVLIGDMRKNGEYFSWQADIIAMGIGKLRNILIKTQHNCMSDSIQYSGNFIPIMHEYLLIFMKDRHIISFGQMIFEKEQRIARRLAGTWKQIVLQTLKDLGGSATIEETVSLVTKRIDPEGNHHVAAKIRQTLQDPMFQKVAQGQYTLAHLN